MHNENGQFECGKVGTRHMSEKAIKEITQGLDTAIIKNLFKNDNDVMKYALRGISTALSASTNDNLDEGRVIFDTSETAQSVSKLFAALDYTAEVEECGEYLSVCWHRTKNVNAERVHSIIGTINRILKQC